MTYKEWKELCEFLNIQNELFFVEVSEEYYETIFLPLKKIKVPCKNIKIGDLPEIKISRRGNMYFRKITGLRITECLFAEYRTEKQIIQIIKNLL